MKQTANTAQPYVVPGPVGFSANDVIVAVQGANCTLSTVNAGGVAVDAATGFATLTHTRVAGADGVTYTAVDASLVNLGQAASMGRVAYTVDTSGRVLRTQNRLPTDGPVNPVVNDVVNLKAQYGLDTDNDGAIDTWQDATGDLVGRQSAEPAAGDAAADPRRAHRHRHAQSRNTRRTRSLPGRSTMLDDTVSMDLSDEDQHYRYKVLETVVPLRNALWNRIMNIGRLPSLHEHPAPCHGTAAARRRAVHRAAGHGGAEPRRHRAHPVGRHGHDRGRQPRVQAGHRITRSIAASSRPSRRCSTRPPIRRLRIR